jgi:hypothetical protein
MNILEEMATSKLSILVEDLNGEHSFSNLKAAFGYVESYERLQIPQSVNNKCQVSAQPQSMVDLTTNEIMALLKLNFDKLVAGSVSSDKAIRIAILRARWVRTGNLLNGKNERSTPIDEVDIISDNECSNVIKKYFNDNGVFKGKADGTIDVSNDNFAAAFNSVNLGEWNKIGPLVWGCVAHVFRVRGHHYKDEYLNLYEKTWKGTTLDFPDNVLTWKDMSRTAIHSFGVKALERSTRFYEENQALTTNLVIRRDAIPCGAALIGTSYATLSQFQSTPWYNNFYDMYSSQIDDLIANYKRVKEAGLSCHISCGLYGVPKVAVSTAAAEALAPILVGYINGTPSGSAIKDQKAMTKYSESNPMMMQIMREWIQLAVERSSKKEDITEALGGKSTHKAIQGTG